MDTRTIYFEEYKVGDARTSYARTMTEADIVIHAGLGDFFPHHMDVEFAKTTSFGQRIAHGTLIFGMAMGMNATEINPVSFSYGYDRMRFVKPVFIGDTIYTVVTVIEKKDHPKKPTMGLLVERVEVKNQRDETVMVVDHLSLVERQPTA